MSRTHKTKPFNAKACQRLIAVWEDHDHSEGPCDLPELNYQTMQLPYRATRCHWTADYNDPIAFCGCHLCSGHRERKIDKKRNRLAARNETRKWVRDPDSYDESVIEEKRSTWW